MNEQGLNTWRGKMGSISRLQYDMPFSEDELVQRQDKQRKEAMSEEENNRNQSQQPMGTVVPDTLQERVQNYCQKTRLKGSRNGNPIEWL